MKLTLKSKVVGLRDIERVFQLSFSNGDQYTTGGNTIDFTAAVNAVNADRAKLPAFVGPGSNPPSADRFRLLQVPAGYDGEVIVNTVNPTLKNYLFKISASGGSELAQGNIPAAIYNDVNGFTFSCVTPKKYG